MGLFKASTQGTGWGTSVDHPPAYNSNNSTYKVNKKNTNPSRGKYKPQQGTNTHPSRGKLTTDYRTY